MVTLRQTVSAYRWWPNNLRLRDRVDLTTYLSLSCTGYHAKFDSSVPNDERLMIAKIFGPKAALFLYVLDKVDRGTFTIM